MTKPWWTTDENSRLQVEDRGSSREACDGVRLHRGKFGDSGGAHPRPARQALFQRRAGGRVRYRAAARPRLEPGRFPASLRIQALGMALVGRTPAVLPERRQRHLPAAVPAAKIVAGQAGDARSRTASFPGVAERLVHGQAADRYPGRKRADLDRTGAPVAARRDQARRTHGSARRQPIHTRCSTPAKCATA